MGEEDKSRAGEVKINPDVIAQFAGMEAMGCFGIVGMGAVSLKDGFVKILKNDKLSKGVSVDIKDDRISIDFHIIVAYGVSIQAVSDNLMRNVAYQVENFTGMKVEKVNVYVEGVRVID